MAGEQNKNTPVIIVGLVCVAVLGFLAGTAMFGGAPSAGGGGAVATPAETSQPQELPEQSAEVSGPMQPGTLQVASVRRPLFLEVSKVSSALDIKPQAPSIAPDASLSNVYITPNTTIGQETQSMLARQSFAMVSSYFYEFHSIYEDNRYMQVPSLVTVDSLMHSYHLYFAYLLKNIEKGELQAKISQASKLMAEASMSQLEALAGTEWEAAAKRNVGFFSVGAILLDPTYAVPELVANEVSADLQQIQLASGAAPSAVTGQEEDFTQYIPRGYYAGNALLEQYFRAMMWYGRMNFAQKEEDLTRSALLITMALQGEALEPWSSAYTVTSFFVGASDDLGFYEYQPALEAAYGAGAGVEALPGNDAAWQSFKQAVSELKAPQINSVPGVPASEAGGEKGFRFMGQRFTLDAAIFQQLCYDAIPGQRFMADALDVPAVLGSDAALKILDEKGDTSFEGYSDAMQRLRDGMKSAPETLWTASLYNQWIDTLRPLLAEKGEGYPLFMQGDAWARKNLSSFLGSYTELKHDTVLYAKQVYLEGGGYIPQEVDDRGYVEPEPEVFERLANLCSATADGLERYGMLRDSDKENLSRLENLARTMGGIAEKELNGGSITDEEYEAIRSYGVELEHFWVEVNKEDAEAMGYQLLEMCFPAAVVADIATNSTTGTVLELGTGYVGELYALAPIDGELHVVRGAAYTFYQFEQPMADRLTDAGWREMLNMTFAGDGQYHGPAPSQPRWTLDFLTFNR